jgi:hypothetical protein
MNTKRLRQRSLVIVVTVLFIVCTAKGGEADKLIVPGRRIGPISIGMTASDLLRILGEPDQTDHSSTATGYKYTSRGLRVQLHDRDQRVSSIAALDASWMTAQGLRVGDSELKMKSRLGAPSSSRTLYSVGDHQESGFFDYPGLLVEIRGGKISGLQVLGPR